MKILMYSSGRLFTGHQTGGTKRFVELATYLQRHHAAELCCQDDDGTLAANGLHAKYHFRDSADGKPRFLPPEARRLLKNRTLLKQIGREGYDAVVSFDVPPAIGLCLAGVKNLVLMIRKDLIGYETVSAAMNWKGKLKLAYLWLCEDICLKKAKYIVTQCEYDKDQLISRHKRLVKRLEKKFRIQINNVNPSWIQQKSARTVAEERSDHRFRVCFVGNFNDARKGHDLLLAAAKRLHQEDCDIKFEIIGAGEDLERFRSQYESDSIVFHGRLDNPMAVLKSCDLMVVPSLADSCPNTVMESLYNGIAVIGSRAGGIPEILLDETALFDLDAEALALRINELYKNADALTRLRLSQQKRKTELEFDWAEKIAQLIAVVRV